MVDIPFDATLLLALIFFTPMATALIVAAALLRKVGRKRGWAPPDQISWVERRPVLWGSVASLAIYIHCFLYGTLIEIDWVETTHTVIEIDRPPLGYDRFRIVHLSDLHLERLGRRERRVVELVRGADPHLIVLTGDYMNVREAGGALVEMLQNLRAPHGVVGVAGNWDEKFPLRELFRRGEAVLLDDETRLLERDGHRLRLVGQSVYPGTPLRDLLPKDDDGAVTIYLHHKPDAVDELRGRQTGQRVDLFLCGHTHGGQVCVPFWGAVITLSKYHKQFERGLYEDGGVPMYVNRGVGVEGGAVPRVRFLSRPEVAVIDLVVKK